MFPVLPPYEPHAATLQARRIAIAPVLPLLRKAPRCEITWRNDEPVSHRNSLDMADLPVKQVPMSMLIGMPRGTDEVGLPYSIFAKCYVMFVTSLQKYESL